MLRAAALSAPASEDDDVVAKDHQRRDRSNAKLRGDFLLNFGVDLGEQGVRMLAAASATGANARRDCAPRGPE
jgi:hypothetical protein